MCFYLVTYEKVRAVNYDDKINHMRYQKTESFCFNRYGSSTLSYNTTNCDIDEKGAPTRI